MFERYTEAARRSIFFARYEASTFGSSHIETEHLLLGILREHRLLETSKIEAIRREIEARTPQRERISTSVNLPLSSTVKQALTYAAGEAEALNQRNINTGHLMLGLMRAEGLASELLRKHGADRDAMRARLAELDAPPSRGPAANDEERASQAAAAIEPAVTRLQDMVKAAEHHLEYFSERDAHRPKGIERKEALGHLIDHAAAHHLWLGSALNDGAAGEPEEPPSGWSGALRFSGTAWSDLVKVWVSLNELLVDVMESVPEEKADAAMAARITAYVDYCEERLARILTRG